MPTSRSIPVWIVLALFAILGASIPAARLLAAPPSAQASLHAAWRLAERAGRYEYTSEIRQQTTPLPSLANVGRGPSTEQLYVEGAIDSASETMALKLWSQNGSVANGAGALELEIKDGQALGRVNGGEWEPVDDVSGLFAPGRDPLGFLHAATKITTAGSETRALSTGAVSFTRYGFTLDGVAFAEFMRDQAQAELLRTGELPDGMNLELAQIYVKMSGSGEIWVAGNGLPLRLILDISFPPENDEQVAAHISTDFANWDTRPTLAGPLARVANALPRTDLSRHFTPGALAALLALFAVVALIVRSRSSRKVYTAVVGAVMLTMLVGPLLQQQQAYAFSSEMDARRVEDEQQRETQRQVQKLTQPSQTSAWDPHQNPLSGAVASGESQPMAQAVSAPDLDDEATVAADDIYTVTLQQFSLLPATDDGTDSDGDGMTDFNETLAWSNPNDADTDDDGLSDGVERYELGTSSAMRIDADGDGNLDTTIPVPDTDGDGIPDGVEVAGFSYDGKNWYLDPIETDTNVDGIFDGVDCLYEPGAGGGLTCPDTDGDGSPDAFDADDDADGVPDKVDGARTAVVGDPSTGISGGRFGFALSDLTDDKPLYVDFQLRPTNATHLWYSQNVLDWPANDRQGQIQRVHKSTFGSSGELADGDMRLVPMLELEIPYENGRYGNLPTIDSAPVITPATPFSQWLDQDEMSSFGVNVRFKDESGTLLAYVPLTLIREEENNSPVAFGGRMFYQPGMDTWGALHQARLIWLVELKTDSCTDTPADYETGLSEDDRRLKWCEDTAHWQEDGSRVVHIYDDPWYLTGFSVREDHGALAAVAFQNPAFSAAQTGYSPTGFNDDWTWSLAQGLERSWLAGAKDGSGERALTLDQVTRRWDNRQNGSVSAEQRWNIPQGALVVERVPGTGVFEHQAQLATIPTSHTKRLLDTYFGPQVDSGITDPTLLFMREEYFRSLTAEANSAQVTPANGATWVNGELQGNGLTLEMEDEAAPFTAVAAMNWAPFRYAGAGVWQSYPIQSYWQDKGVDMKALLDDRWPDADEATMATVIAQSYYLTLFRGVDSLVELGGEPSNLQSQLTDGAMPGYLFGDETVRLGLSLMNTVLTFDTIMRFTQMQWADLIVTVSNRIAPLEFMIRRQINPQIDQKDLFFYFNPNKRIKYAAEEFFKTTTAVALKRARVANFVDEDGRTVKLHNSGRSVRAIKVASAVAPGGVLDKGTTALATVAAVGQIIATASGDIEKPNVALAFAVINTTLATLSAVTVVSSVYISAAATGKSIGFVVQRSLTAIPKNGINGFGASFAIILTGAISVGLFVYQVTAMRLQPNSLPFNLAIAGLVSSLVVAVLFIAIGSVPLFGQLITAVIALIDAVINLICVATGAATGGAGTFVRDYLCGGISGALAKLIQWIIYDQTPLIQLERADRLNLTNFDLSVVDPEKGMQQGNSLRVALDVDTALYKDPLDIDDASIQFPWRLQIEDPNNLKASTFVYALQQGTPQDIHEGLPIGSMRARWQAPTPGGWAAGSNYVTRTPVSTTVVLSNAGVNRAASDSLFLAEGHNFYAQECALVACWLREVKDTIHIDLGRNLVFDIFPATLDDFTTLAARDNGGYVLSWMTNVAIPTPLADADGDNLRSKALGGNDPNDSRGDSDGDALSDFFELQTGSDPALADPDGDGLNDAAEWRYGTDPFFDDTDSDGLTDGAELAGWSFVYAFNGTTPLSTWVRPDPLMADTDGDGYRDAQEKAWGLNPRWLSTAELLSLSSAIVEGDSLVRPGETIAYKVTVENELRNRYAFGLLDVEFPAGLTSSQLDPHSFQIAPQQSISRTGQVAVAPSVTASQLVSLTNVAGAVAVDRESELGSRTLWLRFEESGPNYADSALGGYQATCSVCPLPVVGGKSGRALDFAWDGADDTLTLNAPPRELGLARDSFTIQAWVRGDDFTHLRPLLHSAGNDNWAVGFYNGAPVFKTSQGQLDAPVSLTTREWYRVAWSYDEDSHEHAIFINGQKVASSRSAITFDYSSLAESDAVLIGGGMPGWFTFNGLIDELEIYPVALADEALGLGTGSGQVFYYQFEDTLVPASGTWLDDSLYANQVQCAVDPTDPNERWCPQAQANAFDRQGYRFFHPQGQDPDILQVGPNPALDLSRGNGQFSISVWLHHQPSADGWLMGNGDPNSSTGSAYPALRVDGSKVTVEFGGSANECYLEAQAPELGATDADRSWHHLAATFDGTTLTAYANNRVIGTQSCEGKRPGSANTVYIGNSHISINQGLQGALDELRIFNYALDEKMIADLFWNTLPVLELRFDEAPARDTFRDHSLSQISGTCTWNATDGGTCPTSGVQGRANQAVLFDGANDFVSIGTTDQLALSESSFTVSTWVNVRPNRPDNPIMTTDLDATGSEGFFELRLEGDVPIFQIGVNNGMIGAYDHPISPNEWHHLAFRYDYDPDPSVKQGTMALFVDSQQVADMADVDPLVGSIAVWLGRWGQAGQFAYLGGMLDHLVVYREALSDAHIASLATQVPTVNLHLDERGSPTTFANDANDALNAGCFGDECPKAGLKGRMYQGVAFDGQNDRLLVPDNGGLDLSRFSIGMWVKPTQHKDGRQVLLSKGHHSAPNNYALHLKPNSMTAEYQIAMCPGGTMHQGDVGTLLEGSWNHVMFTYDGRRIASYVNGSLTTETPASGTPCTNDTQVALGFDLNTGVSFFAGEMDEVVIYGEALSPADVRELANYQANWYDTSVGHNILIDADNPSVALDFSAPFVPQQPTVLAIEAADPTSGIASVEYSIDNGPWQAATRDGESWLFTFSPSSQGVYPISVQATDEAGNSSMSGRYVVNVDGVGPTIGPINVESSAITGVGRDNTANNWTLNLEGVVSSSGSPVATVLVQLLDAEGVPVTDPLPAALSGPGWQLAYPFATQPNGSYTIRVEATDQVGNRTIRDVVDSIDGTPPEADIASPTPNTTQLTSAATLAGAVEEQGVASGVSGTEIAFDPAGWDDRSSATWLDSGLIMHLPLDDGIGAGGTPTGEFRDSSAGGPIATCTASACPTAGMRGVYANAVQFDGADDRLNTALNNAGLPAFTTGAWVRPAAGQTAEQPLLVFNTSAGAERMRLAYDPVQQRFLFRDGTSPQVGTTTALSDTWHHVLLAVAADGSAILYLNGSPDATFSTAARPQAGDNLLLGKSETSFYAGLLDDVVLYESALSDSEVKDFWRGFGAVLRLGFDEQTLVDEQVVADDSRFGHEPMLHLGANSARYAEPGIVGAGALAFDGDFIDVPDHPALDLSDGRYTQMAWVYPQPANNEIQPIISDMAYHNYDELARFYPFLGVTERTKLWFGFGDGTSWDSHTTASLLTENAWNFVAVSFDGTTHRAYVNGVLSEETTKFAGRRPYPSQRLDIGLTEVRVNPFTRLHFQFKGQLDEVSIYRQALPAEEIAALYHQRWQPATLAASNVVSTTWSFPLPAGLKGAYQLDLRTTDANGNVSYGQQGSEQWLGAIDTRTPAPTIVHDSSAAIQYNRWFPRANATASGGLLHWAMRAGERVSVDTTVASTSVTLLSHRGPGEGKARVFIDGRDKGVLDLYAPTDAAHSAVFSGLRLRRHTIVVQVLGTRNPLSNGTKVRVDGFESGGVTIEDSSLSVRYGGWQGLNYAPAYNGSFRRTATAGDTARLTFQGTRVTWLTARGPNQGRADVYIDGVRVRTVDLYAPRQGRPLHVTITGLTPGRHTITIRALGTRNPASRGAFVAFDGFSIP